MTGYRHPGYARSFVEFGTPRHLPLSDGWLLQRPIPGFAACDAMGCYPLFACGDWAAVGADLDALAGELVSVVLVSDPFGGYTPELLLGAFDTVRPFKEHFITDYGAGGIDSVSRHHRFHARRALKVIDVELCERPAEFLEEWCVLYGNLIERHGLSGMKAFSRAAFAEQLRVPGSVILRASHSGRTVGAQWYYVQGDVSYSHLAALSPDGYALGAAYALQWSAIEHFSRVVRWLDHGAGAGAADELAGGLTFFKRGWANARRPAFLCGRILAPDLYARVTRTAGVQHTTYFPPYRSGELV